jgi:hypothetical protein
VLAKVMERLVMSKQGMCRFHMKSFSLKILIKVKVKQQYWIEITNRLSALENLDTEEDASTSWEIIREK